MLKFVKCHSWTFKALQQHVPSTVWSVPLTNTGLVVEVAPVVVVVVVVEGLVVVGARVIVVVVEVEVVVVEVVVGAVEVLMVVGAMVVEGRGVGVAVKAEARGASVSSTTREEVGESKWLKTRQQKHQTGRRTQER